MTEKPKLGSKRWVINRHEYVNVSAKGDSKITVIFEAAEERYMPIQGFPSAEMYWQQPLPGKTFDTRDQALRYIQLTRQVRNNQEVIP